LSELFRQLQLAGIFVAYFEIAPRDSTESFLGRIGLRPALLHSIATAIETYFPGKVSLSCAPAVYNRAQWSNPKKLGGYAGRDLTVKPSDLIISYLGCWEQAEQHPASASFRFTRLGFWYWRESGDVFAALTLLLDLYKAGFFLRKRDFGIAALTICDAYTRGFDIASLGDLNFHPEGAYEVVSGELEGLIDLPHSKEKAQELMDWLLDCAIDESDRARQAPNPDDWIIHHTWLGITTELLSSLGERHKKQLATTQRAIVSQFGEVRADMGAARRLTRFISMDGRPVLVMNLAGVQSVGIEYQLTYGAGWLDKMLEDRILAPEALREKVKEAYTEAKLPTAREIEIPPDWQMVSESVAWPLCVVLDRELMLERSRDFEADLVSATCRELGHSPDPDSENPLPWDFDSAAQAKARRKLSVTQLAALLEDKSLFWKETAAGAIGKFEKIADLYQWNHMVRRELGIRYDEFGNVDEGFRHMRAAILLDPTDAMNWHSLGVILNRMGERQEAAFASAISEMINQRSPK
jgi:tetratricopeptide (TPR) repeat protein